MTDRFHGFRFEINGDNLDKSILEAIRDEADNLACFGWTQLVPTKGTIVGEGRCSKTRGKTFQEKIAKISPAVKESKFLVYEDTKIRLHYSDFKILPGDRETCFLDEPHQCPEFEERNKPSTRSKTTSQGKSEL